LCRLAGALLAGLHEALFKVKPQSALDSSLLIGEDQLN
jgi:hypothetical protein